MLAEVKSDGTNAVSYQYDVYGTILNQRGSLYDERQFAGEQADPTGLTYLRARFYDAATGRLLSRDPLPDAVADPAMHQPYAYSGDNPALATDPSGKILQYVDGTYFDMGGEYALAAPVFATPISSTVQELVLAAALQHDPIADPAGFFLDIRESFPRYQGARNYRTGPDGLDGAWTLFFAIMDITNTTRGAEFPFVTANGDVGAAYYTPSGFRVQLREDTTTSIITQTLNPDVDFFPPDNINMQTFHVHFPTNTPYNPPVPQSVPQTAPQPTVQPSGACSIADILFRACILL